MHNHASQTAAIRRLLEPQEATKIAAEVLHREDVRSSPALAPSDELTPPQRLEAFLRSDRGRRLLGPVGGRAPAAAVFDAFAEWCDAAGFGGLTQTAAGRLLASSRWVLRGRGRGGVHYAATLALRQAWSGAEEPTRGTGAAGPAIVVHGTLRPSERDDLVVIKADHLGAPFGVVAIVHASIFDAARAIAWALEDRASQLRRARATGWRGPVFVAYVTPFELPEADRAELDRRSVACICNPHLFREVVS